MSKRIMLVLLALCFSLSAVAQAAPSGAELAAKAATLDAAGKSDEAGNTYEAAAKAYEAEGHAHEANNANIKAADMYMRAMKETTALATKAAALEAAGKIDEAALAYNSLGKAYEAGGDKGNAAKAFSKSADLYEKVADALLKKPATPNATAHPGTAPQLAAPSAPPAPAREVHLPPLAARPGYVIGRAIFEDGRPVPNFSVEASGFDGQTGTGRLGLITAHDGSYALQTKDTFSNKTPVKAIVSGVSATALIDYHGHHYEIAMRPMDDKVNGTEAGEFHGNSGPGVVRDFVLNLGALKPGHQPDEKTEPEYKNSCYGGHIMVRCDLSRGKYAIIPDRTSLSQVFPGASRVTVTLTPSGPLIDGSQGRPFTQTFTMDGPWKGLFLRGIPLGIYNATASLTDPKGAAHSLQLSLKPITAPVWQASVPIEFLPTRMFLDGSDEVPLYLGT